MNVLRGSRRPQAGGQFAGTAPRLYLRLAFHQSLEAGVLPERSEGGIDLEPAGREVVGDLKQGLEQVERLVGLTDEKVVADQQHAY